MSTPLALLHTVILLAGNAFFVGAEFAVTSSRRSQLEPQAEAGDARATTALWALQNVSRMLATAQLGAPICVIFINNAVKWIIQASMSFRSTSFITFAC